MLDTQTLTYNQDKIRDQGNYNLVNLNINEYERAVVVRSYIYIIIVSAKDPLRVHINYVISYSMGVAV